MSLSTDCIKYLPDMLLSQQLQLVSKSKLVPLSMGDGIFYNTAIATFKPLKVNDITLEISLMLRTQFTIIGDKIYAEDKCTFEMRDRFSGASYKVPIEELEVQINSIFNASR